tara:strand:- start:40 stop:315 length:276 start_codon:yes stop_codon:yes gene_type:complete
MVFTDEYNELYNDYVEFNADVWLERNTGSTASTVDWSQFKDYETDAVIQQMIDAELDMLFGSNRTEPREFYIELLQLDDSFTIDMEEELHA